MLLPGYGDTSAAFTAHLAVIDPAQEWVVAVAEPHRVGPDGPLWYTVDEDGPDPQGVAETAVAVAAAIAVVAETAAIDPAEVVLAGHSQGGAAALATCLDPAAGRRPRAVAALASYLPHRDDGIDPTRAVGLPALFVHGLDDRVMDPIRGRGAARAFERWGAQVEWEDVAGGHRLGPALLTPLARLLSRLAVDDAGSH